MREASRPPATASQQASRLLPVLPIQTSHSGLARSLGSSPGDTLMDPSLPGLLPWWPCVRSTLL